MPEHPLRVVILGLSITSSWGNGHATTWRGLVRELSRRGHDVTFLECDKPWYANNRDLPHPPYCRTILYQDLEELRDCYTDLVRDADVVCVGSYVPNGVAVGQWVCDSARGLTAFYDIDTPVTLAKLARGDYEYLTPDLIPRYGVYFSFTGGPTLRHLEHHFGSPRARALFCSADPESYFPEETPSRYDLAYMGTYSDDRQPTVEELLLKPASMLPDQRFCVVGPQYPDIGWPPNVARIDHLPPAQHRSFYNSQRFTLNVTRADMIRAGYSPSVRLFEAGACATAIITDPWEGLADLFVPGQEILIARSAHEVYSYLTSINDDDRRRIGERARARVMAQHTAAHRAEEFETEIQAALGDRRASAPRPMLQSQN